MRLRTAEDLVADVRKRAGCEGDDDDFVTDEEILEYLNQELAELRGHLRMSEGQPHQRLTKTYAVEAGTTLYDLPRDFWELLGITMNIGGREMPMDPFMENERASLNNGPFIGTIFTPMYRIANNQLEILPANQALNVTIRYAPCQGRVRLGQVPPDTVDGYNGYEIAAIYGATATVQEKEKNDPAFYEGRKVRIIEHIKALAASRDAARPERVTDVTGGLSDEFSR